ncbi:hypothetical protein N7U66_10155 [Lacinutrix neustonica]|uniref:Uncharacterized protein n=1 Tax=Lacinutrix neustonica TaxID=2980107 RepID=A0A9E8N0R3_9FLAO|nr:hypothetical protein [Lacinutrix neustonica]WAC03749.1 hypothetical protein N7U66_10155 [Lacinutrix neustonica]
MELVREDTSTVSITIYETFTAGTVSLANPATFCEAGLPAAFDLTTLLDNEDPNGQWTQGTLSTDPVVTSPIDLTGFGPGTYDFTYTQNIAPNSCPRRLKDCTSHCFTRPKCRNSLKCRFL